MINSVNNRGQSILEVIIAMAIFSLIGAAISTLVVGGFTALMQGGQQTEAENLAQEAIEAIRSIHNGAWNEFIYAQSAVTINAGEWVFSGEGTSQVIEDYTRTINFADVCRDASNNIIDCPGTYTDVHSKKVTVQINWEARPGITNTVQRISYLTNWDSKDWVQTDWAGGAGQNIWSDSAKYDSDDTNIDSVTIGEIKLISSGGECGTQAWSFDTPSEYTYDSAKIEVTGGAAQLISQGGSSCIDNPGATACATFSDSGTCAAQAGCSWGGGAGGTCSNVGSCSAAGSGGCDVCGGCVKSKGSCTGTLNCSAFSDQTTCTTCTQCAWEAAGACGGTATACSNFADSGSCAAQSGCSWSSGGGYPTDKPTINPTSSYSVSGIDSWSSFTETATKNGGEIYYQISDDDGASWQYWNGSIWTTAGASNYNTAAVINTNISLFPTTNSQIKFRAFLQSDGSQQVQLDNIKIRYSQSGGGGGGYASSGYMISSAFDMGDASPIQVIEWDDVVPVCSPACAIKLEVSTAPDAGGVPGSWSNWYGAAGSGTYFTNARGSLISTDLNNNRWMRYRATLTGDGSNTPILNEVRVNYK